MSRYFPRISEKKPKGFKEGKCKCGNKYFYCGCNLGMCVACLDKLEEKK